MASGVPVYLCPIASLIQYFTDAGIVLAGGTISTFVAGTTTPTITYTDSTGIVANPFIITLNESGRLPNNVGIWQPQGVLLKIVVHDSAGDPIGPIFDQIPGINDISNIGSISIGTLLYPRNAAEIAANVFPVNFIYPNGPYRYGAVGDGVTDDTIPWQTMVIVSEYHFVLNGSFKFTKKVQANAFLTIEGSTRQTTQISPTSFADYVLEIGATSTGPNPNVGALKRLRFFGGQSNNLGLLHMQGLSHMWNLSELLFQSSQCPGLVIDNCWDSFYSDIDNLSVGGTLTDPSTNACLIIRGSSNNIYFKGCRLEQAPNGVIYAGALGPFYFITGKIDQGFIPQGATAVTVTAACQLFSMEHFFITGVSNQYPFTTAGGLSLGDVVIDGGSGMPAAIKDTRAYVHNDPVSFPGISQAAIGVEIPTLRLSNVQFNKAHPSVSTITPAALQSKIFPIRIVNNTAVTANGGVGGGNITIAANVNITFNDQYTGCYLVHNSDGYRYQSRRKILSCFPGGTLTIAGTNGCVIDGDYSIEYAGGHYTPITADAIQLDNTMTMFTQLSAGVTLVGAPTYISSTASPAYGMTFMGVNGPGLAQNLDLTGYYLIDEVTGTPYMIGYGIDANGNIGVMYDNSVQLTTFISQSHTFRIQAGYFAGIRETAAGYEWAFAGKHHVAPAGYLANIGFDKDNIPLWGVGTNSNTFNGTLTGFATAITGPVVWTKQDNIVSLRILANMLGTSNSTTLTLSGLPSILIPPSSRRVYVSSITDASVDFQSGSATIDPSGVITFAVFTVSGTRLVPTAFTNAGIKGLDNSWEMIYSIE